MGACGHHFETGREGNYLCIHNRSIRGPVVLNVEVEVAEGLRSRLRTKAGHVLFILAPEETWMLS